MSEEEMVVAIDAEMKINPHRPLTYIGFIAGMRAAAKIALAEVARYPATAINEEADELPK